MPEQQINNNFQQIQQKIAGLFAKHKNKIPPEFHASFGDQTTPQSITIYLVRHGSTDLNEKGHLRGWMDVPLSVLGIAQAKAVAKFLKDAQITKIYTSDLKRCQRTADFIGEATGVKVIDDQGLRPLNFGDLNGQPMKVVSPIMDDFNEKWSQNPNYTAHNSESFTEFQNRNLGFLHKVLQEAQSNDKIVLVGSLRNCSLILSFILLNSQPPSTTANLSTAQPLQGHNIQTMAIVGQEPGSVSELQFNQGQLSFIRNIHNEESS